MNFGNAPDLTEKTPMSEDSSKVHYGKKVRVSAQLDARDYTPIGIQKRRPGATGIIVAHSDSHGLCFEVDHEDGSSGWYDPDELMEAKTVYAPLTNDPPTQNGGDDVTDCDGCINHCENDGGDPHCLAFGLDLIGQWTIGAGGPIGMRCSECRKQNAGLSTCQISERVFDVSSGSAIFMDAD